MIVDITNEIVTSIKTLLPTVTVNTSFNVAVKKFPCVTVEESANSTYTESVDTSGEKHNRVSFDINVFDESTKKMSVVKGLRNQIDTLMTTTYGMTRVVHWQFRIFLTQEFTDGHFVTRLLLMQIRKYTGGNINGSINRYNHTEL